ncbi:MAG: hypothetical protein QOK02_719 [Mycobacterium sp.]|nr:hypothetical protein [Mycobacterium sp.]
MAAVTVVSACGSSTAPPAPAPTSAAATTPTVVPPPPAPTPTTRTVNWFDLEVGDCLVDPPPVDPTVITVAVTDCASPHQAEVFLRAPMAVNTAIADVIDRTCGAGLTGYTGHSASDGDFSLTYLIDSNQNRTSSNPDPSTVICLLEAPGGGPLTQSAHR